MPFDCSESMPLVISNDPSSTEDEREGFSHRPMLFDSRLPYRGNTRMYISGYPTFKNHSIRAQLGGRLEIRVPTANSCRFREELDCSRSDEICQAFLHRYPKSRKYLLLILMLRFL